VYRSTRLLQARNGTRPSPTKSPHAGACRLEQRAREKYTEYHLHRKDKFRNKIRSLIDEDGDEAMHVDEDDA